MKLQIGRCTIALACAALVAPMLRAQVVTGTVRNEEGRAPLPGAIVLLTSASGARFGGTLTDDAGVFRLRAPTAGTYTLRVDVVGYRSLIVPPFSIDSGATVTRDLVFRFERTTLPRVAVTAASRCSQLSGDAGDAPQLWAEARKTLEAARLAVQESRFTIALRRYDRTISLPDSVLRASRSWTQRGVSQNPFESLTPEAVARNGFSVTRDSAHYYYAPDASILLSDPFVAGHCFGTRRGGPSGTVGLSFRPLQTTGRVDIDGVLWLDSATAELRSLEYRYVPAVGRPPVGGGFVAFGQYPSGLWGVRGWAIRLPILRVFENRRRPDGALGRFVDTVVTAFREEGGELITGNAQSNSSGTRLAGTVFDSTLGAPLAGAMVTVEGLGITARTDSTGRFAIDSLADEGEVRVRMWHARLDSLGVGISTTRVRLHRGAETTANFTVPGVAEVARLRCPSGARNAPRVIMGILRAIGDSAPAVAADVVLLERRPGSDGASDSLIRHVDVTNDAGRYAFCGVERGSQGWLLVRSGIDWSAPRVVAGDSVVTVSLVPLRMPLAPPMQATDSSLLALAAPGTILGRTTGGGAPRLDGWVLLSGDTPRTVEVLVDDIMRATAAPDGSFRLTGIALGTRKLMVRAPGHAATTLGLSVQEDQSQLLLVTLKPAPVVVVQNKPPAPDARLVEFRQRRNTGEGVYLDRADISKRGARTLTDLLRTVPGVRVIARDAGYRYVSSHFRRLGSSAESPDGGLCDMMFYVDGLPFPMESGDADARIRVTEIAAMEVYVSAGSVPRRFAGTNAACGVILLWRG